MKINFKICKDNLSVILIQALALLCLSYAGKF